MLSRWNPEGARDALVRWGDRYGERLALRVYTSRLLGAEPALVLHGGGNTSVKGEAVEPWGAPVPVVWVKGSGWDLGTIEPEGFPACRLAPLRELAALPALSDVDMVKALRGQMLDPASPTPSVEALLHALLPAPWVDHTHADAVLALLDQPDSRDRARDVFGESFGFLPYVMPGFDLARAVREQRPWEGRRGLLLDRHGIFTWGETAEESYERMIEAVSMAEAALRRGARVSVPRSNAGERGGTAGDLARVEAGSARDLLLDLPPLLRGAVQRRLGEPVTVVWRRDPELRALVEHATGRTLADRGPATPDHVLRVKPFPLWLDTPATDVPALRDAVEAALDAFSTRYAAYFSRNQRGRPITPLGPEPRVVLVPAAGAALVIGSSPGEARITGDVFVHDAWVMLHAEALGEYRPVSEAELFEVEHWSLEQAKLGQRRAPRRLEGRVALVTGAARGIGLATARRLLEHGARVVLNDRDEPALRAALEALAARHGDAARAAPGDVTRDADVRHAVECAVLEFGGLDLVVSNAGTAPAGLLHDGDEGALARSLEVNLLAHQRVARHAVRVMTLQRTGGCLLFNASKSAFAPGPAFGPYAVAKAALVALVRQLAIDLAPQGIRTGAVNADRVRTELFGGGLLEERARARGLSPDEYFRQNLLGRETLAEDVAEAFVSLATAEATTGAVLPVDGGNPAAFPR